MAARGRKAGFRMTEEHRSKIRKSRILQELIKFAENDPTTQIEYQNAQIGVALLKKVMPDMTENMIKGEGENGEVIVKIAREIIKSE